jgi:branched-chain amino acid transport system ATP-binding protein
MTLDGGEILGLVDPNGVGKTTFVNVLPGFQKLDYGQVHLGGTDITRWKPEKRARCGLTWTFEVVRLFKGWSVFENMSRAAEKTRERSRDNARKVLYELGLTEVRYLQADTLPYGFERRVGVACALVPNPNYILFVEPSAGLNETEGEGLRRFVLELRDRISCGVLLIGHKIKFVFGLSERALVPWWVS